jgi:hypothetical protein
VPTRLSRKQPRAVSYDFVLVYTSLLTISGNQRNRSARFEVAAEILLRLTTFGSERRMGGARETRIKNKNVKIGSANIKTIPKKTNFQ